MSKIGSVEIAATLRQEITGGAYRQNDRLPASRELADRFGVARNTLREALSRLQAEGLLETRAGSGTYVVQPPGLARAPEIEHASPIELIDARFALEPHICRLCVLHGRREDFEMLQSLCDRMDGSENDPVAFSEADTAFHRALAATTRNNLLIWLLDQISSVRGLDEWVRMRRLTLDADIIGQYNVQHRQILDTIRARDPEAAATHMKDHLETARLSLTRALQT